MDQIAPRTQHQLTWFTSDTHFGHRKMVKDGHRPFLTVEAMDEHLIEQWNSVIRPWDKVYHLGDFALCPRFKAQEIFDRLNGEKHGIRGNHDEDAGERLIGWASYQSDLYLRFNGDRLFLYHYPIESWRNAAHGALHLHGHCHGNLPQRWNNRVDVGVDYWGLKPVSIGQIKHHLAQFPDWIAPDHHTPTIEVRT